MRNEREQQQLTERLKEMPEKALPKAISALGSFASGFLSGWEAAKAETETQSA